jgi:hypothetical protein
MLSSHSLIGGLGRARRGRRAAARQFRAGISRHARENEAGAASDHRNGEIGGLKVGGRDRVASARP